MKELDASAAAIVSMEASVEETRVTDVLTADAETQARNDLKQDIGGARLQALAEAAELLKKKMGRWLPPKSSKTDCMVY